jgi:uncharacterized protein YndB with AHSA1/START domain
MAAHDFAVTHSSAIPNWRTEDALYTALDDEFDDPAGTRPRRKFTNAP